MKISTKHVFLSKALDLGLSKPLIILNSIELNIKFSLFTVAHTPHPSTCSALWLLCNIIFYFSFCIIHVSHSAVSHLWKQVEFWKQALSFLRDFVFIAFSARTPFPTALSKPAPLQNLGNNVFRKASPVAPPTFLLSITQLLSRLVINTMIRAVSEGYTYAVQWFIFSSLPCMMLRRHSLLFISKWISKEKLETNSYFWCSVLCLKV